MAEEIAAQPNHRIMDLNKIQDTEGFKDEAYDAAVNDAGGHGVTVFDAPWRDVSNMVDPGDLRVKLRFSSFKCIRSQVGEHGRDEVYFVNTAGSDRVIGESKATPEVGALEQGDYRRLDWPFFEGRVLSSVVGHLEAWEADQSTSSFYEMMHGLETRGDLCGHASKIADMLPGAQKAALVLTVVEQALKLVAWLQDCFRNGDDYIWKQEFSFTRHGLNEILSSPVVRCTLNLTLVDKGVTCGKRVLTASGFQGSCTPTLL
ncbi:uncharacterized protein BDV14DRAFT_205893 [Aspergillus stella-maris]|uniref:uncharacterized protein n=1 Tax=Aspergillus stella-maris TaxID=1810926 RepID=UPI003CCD94CF